MHREYPFSLIRRIDRSFESSGKHRRDSINTVTLGCPVCSGEQLNLQQRVVDDFSETVDHRIDITSTYDECVATIRTVLADRAGGRRADRTSARHRLERRQTKPFVAAWVQKSSGSR